MTWLIRINNVIDHFIPILHFLNIQFKKFTHKNRKNQKYQHVNPTVDKTLKENKPLANEQLKQTLRDKLRLKKTDRLSRESRESIMENLDDKMENDTGKEKMNERTRGY